MNESTLQNKRQCNKVVIWGLVIRIAVLIFMLTAATSFTEPYFIADDIKYEETAESYMALAHSLFDMGELKRITNQYLSPFWPWLISISAYAFKWLYAGRVLNVLFSAGCIKLIYEVVYKISGSHKSAMTSAKLFAFLPVTVLICCFPIKDIFITFAILYVFNIFLKLQNSIKVRLWEFLLFVLLMAGIYFSRGAVMELLLLFLFVFYIVKYAKAKKYISTLILTVLVVGAIAVFGSSILASFQTKLDAYGGVSAEAGNIRFLQINGITDIYKLPFTTLFANLQPMRLNLFGTNTISVWYGIMTLLNITMYPVAFANFFYIFSKKQNLLFWILSFMMYSAVIMLSLGVFRHYVFLLPLQIINFPLYFENGNRLNKTLLVAAGSFILFFVIFLMSVF